MSRFRVFIGVFALIILIIACSGKGESSIGRTTIPDTNVVAPEPPAPLQENASLFSEGARVRASR